MYQQKLCKWYVSYPVKNDTFNKFPPLFSPPHIPIIDHNCINKSLTHIPIMKHNKSLTHIPIMEHNKSLTHIPIMEHNKSLTHIPIMEHNKSLTHIPIMEHNKSLTHIPIMEHNKSLTHIPIMEHNKSLPHIPIMEHNKSLPHIPIMEHNKSLTLAWNPPVQKDAFHIRVFSVLVQEVTQEVMNRLIGDMPAHHDMSAKVITGK